MSIAYWCVLAAALLPYVWSYTAKAAGVRHERFDNADPRAWLARQPRPLVHRANAAQANSFEAFAPFAAGVVLALLGGVDPARVDALALAFVVLRFAYGLLYLANRPTLRSLVWAAAFACVIALLTMAARAVDASSALTLAPS